MDMDKREPETLKESKKTVSDVAVQGKDEPKHQAKKVAGTETRRKRSFEAVEDADGDKENAMERAERETPGKVSVGGKRETAPSPLSIATRMTNFLRICSSSSKKYGRLHHIDLQQLVHGMSFLPKLALHRHQGRIYLFILQSGHQIHATRKTSASSQCNDIVYLKAWGDDARDVMRRFQSGEGSLQEWFLLPDDRRTRLYVGQTVSARNRFANERDKEKDPDLLVLSLVPSAIEILGGCKERRLGRDELVERQSRFHASKIYEDIKELREKIQAIHDLQEREFSKECRDAKLKILQRQARDGCQEENSFDQRRQDLNMAVAMNSNFNILSLKEQERAIREARLQNVQAGRSTFLQQRIDAGEFEFQDGESLHDAIQRNWYEHKASAVQAKKRAENGLEACLLCGAETSNRLGVKRSPNHPRGTCCKRLFHGRYSIKWDPAWGKASDHFPKRSPCILWLQTTPKVATWTLEEAMQDFLRFLKHDSRNFMGREELIVGWAEASDDHKGAAHAVLRRILKILCRDHPGVVPRKIKCKINSNKVRYIKIGPTRSRQ
ncbi:hypothetical protein HDU96_008479 [Phlyctochytrium bullatum]|nr:hypothetical protein HDU96_008479 [Phlyctochytrium bullatum]